MKTITLRNLPEPVSRKIAERAHLHQVSLARAATEMLSEACQEQETRYHDLDDLKGKWTPEQAADFDRILSEQRQIDQELWS